MTNPSATAVQLTDVIKHYGHGKRKNTILKKFNMTVPKGAIYGLLGPSGCGKTTLLKIILGLLKVDEGSVTTLGATPGTVGHPVPGKLVGYMPQDIALYGEFTLAETMMFFGRIFRMTTANIHQRTEFLVDLLRLPPATRKIRNMSGGQQRRASFACALLHEPALIILDEPTVGVDPLLRMKIWEYLLTTSSTTHATIMITTHYIEEARQAHVVGLMRNGRLLAEEAPDALLKKHGMTSLENLFLQLCLRDEEQQDGNKTGHNNKNSSSSYEEADSKHHPFVATSESEDEPGDFGGSGQRSIKRRKIKPHTAISTFSPRLPVSAIAAKSLTNGRHGTSRLLVVNVSGSVENSSVRADNQQESACRRIQRFQKRKRKSGAVTDVVDRSMHYVEPADGNININNTVNNNAQRESHAKPHVSCATRFLWYFPSIWRCIALILKNFLIMQRRISVVIFQFCLPAINMVLFCLCIGAEPRHLGLAIVNCDVGVLLSPPPSPDNFGPLPVPPLAVNTTVFASKIYLSHVDSHVVKQIDYGCKPTEAMNDALDGLTFGVVYFQKNFSISLNQRVQAINPFAAVTVDNMTLFTSQLHIYLDMTNQQNGVVLELALAEALQPTLDELFGILKQAYPLLANVQLTPPVRIEQPIYGSRKPSYTDYMAPGIIACVPFFMATGLTSLAFVLEKKEGLLERSYVAGVQPVEMMIGHIITQLLVVCVQVLLLLVVALACFQQSAYLGQQTIFFGIIILLTNEGPLIWVIVFTLVEGLGGMMLGILISSCTNDERAALIIAIGAIFPLLLPSGILWPLESMPKWLRIIAYILPLTLPAEAVRSVMGRGWDLCYYEVWVGLVISLAYMTAMMIAAGIIMTIRKNA